MKRKMKKGVAFLVVALCTLIGALVGGYFGFASNLNAFASTDTATISLYIEPYEETAGTEIIEKELGSTGLYRSAGGEGAPSQIVAEEEYPADIIAEPRTNYYPLLGFVAILLAIILLLLWRFRKKPAEKAGRRKKKR